MYVLSWIKVFFCLLHSSGVAQEKAFFRMKYSFFERATFFQDCKRILVDKDIQVPFVTLENTLVESQLRTYWSRRA